MNVQQIAILILFVLDAAILLALPFFDRKIYGTSSSFKCSGSTFFLNMEYDEPFNRIILSKGGAIICFLVCLSVILLNRSDFFISIKLR